MDFDVQHESMRDCALHRCTGKISSIVKWAVDCPSGLSGVLGSVERRDSSWQQQEQAIVTQNAGAE